MLKALSASFRLNKKFKVDLLRSISFDYGGAILCGFLLSRAVLLGELYPFGLGFLAGRCIYKPKFRGMAFLGVIWGTLLTVKGWPLLGYLLSLCAVYTVFSCYKKEETPFYKIPALIFAIHLLARGSIAFFTDDALYLWIEIIFESIFASIFALVTITGFQAWEKLSEGSTLTVEEVASIGLLVLGLVVGIHDFSVFDCSLQSIFSRWLVLWGALLGGPGGGAASGVVVGLVPSVQGVFTVGSIAYYALGGLLGGIFHNFKKFGVIIGFSLANLFLTFFFTKDILIVQALKETVIAVLLFVFVNPPVPQRLGIAATTQTNSNYEEDFSIYYADKLERMAEVFFELERVFREKRENKTEKNRLNLLFNKATAQVCSGCSLKRVCWEQDFYKTYRALLDICAKLETKGGISENDFGHIFQRRCTRLRELSTVLNSQLEFIKLINNYEKQLQLGNDLLNRQLVGLAKIVENFAEEMKQRVERQEKMEGFLNQKLAEKGINVNHLSVVKSAGEEEEIHIRQNVCERENWCVYMVAPNISQIMDRMYVLKNRHSCGRRKKKEICSYVLVPSRALQVTVGKASCAKEGMKVSGDYCSALALPNHKFALIMGDGMGVGAEAHAESSTAVSLLEKLLLAGFNPQTAVKTVNSALLLRTAGENFATLDVVIINQISGWCDFIKIGGAPSLIRTARGLKIVQSTSPPAGILEEIEPQIFRHYLTTKNNIIMMSDGVWEAIDRLERLEDRWEGLLAKLETFDPQVVADYLLFKAKQATGNRAKDDMCVLVACLEKRN